MGVSAAVVDLAIALVRGRIAENHHHLGVTRYSGVALRHSRLQVTGQYMNVDMIDFKSTQFE